jgi:hypothetical protein
MLQHPAPICFDLGLPREDLSHAIHFAAKKENPWGVMEKREREGDGHAREPSSISAGYIPRGSRSLGT